MFCRIGKKCFPTYISSFRHYAPRKNPGMDNILKGVNDSQQVCEDPEGFGDLESDFMEVHKSHKEHEKEMAEGRKRNRLRIVKNKYFKEKMPNLLTYAEKEQIKFLNNRDPEEWTAEKLSESFPANPEIISKIIKAKWVPTSEQRIRAHDENVMKNWALFNEGKFQQMSKELKEHIHRFAVRTSEDLKNLKIDCETRPALPKPKTSEFQSIITSCKKYQEEQKLLNNSEEKTSSNETTLSVSKNVGNNPFYQDRARSSNKIPPAEEETFLLSEIINKRQVRLEDLKNMKNSPLRPQDETIHYQINNPAGTGIVDTPNEDNHLELNVKKFEFNEIVVSEQDIKKYDVTTVKQRIHIPRKLWQRGATYKVEDCYYDDDGEFLYRIPGMTGKFVHR